MTDAREVQWHDDGYALTRGARTFGPWVVAQVGTLTPDGVTVGEPDFIGSSASGGHADSDVRIVGLAEAREFATQLLAAIDYAETHLAD